MTKVEYEKYGKIVLLARRSRGRGKDKRKNRRFEKVCLRCEEGKKRARSRVTTL